MVADLDRFIPEIRAAFPGLRYDIPRDMWVVPGFAAMNDAALRSKIQRWAYRQHSFSFPVHELGYLLKRLRALTWQVDS